MAQAPVHTGSITSLADGPRCWRRVRAARLAFRVDAEAYFAAFKAAALKARRSILIIGWDVHSRTELEFPDAARAGVPNELAPLLEYLARHNPDLEVRLLDWDAPRLYALDREWLSKARFDWLGHPRVHFALDSEHPIGASHHQKLVVIDDDVAFLGGLDLALDRLDDRGHAADDPRRVDALGKAYPPYHDIQVMVQGEAAEAIGDLARARWAMATGEELDRVAPRADCWPADISADLADIEVGLARTLPMWKGRPEVREIEARTLAAIAAARDWIYIENQYLTSNRIAQALARRLEEADGPEVVVIQPRDSEGWLEHAAMGVRRDHILQSLRRCDAHGRFAAYAPVVGAGEGDGRHDGGHGGVPVKVHSKMMIVDGRNLQVGSANFNNRSMGLDTECNLEIATAESGTAAVLQGMRDGLLAEHLDSEPGTVAAAIAREGSMIRGIDSLRGGDKTLVPLRVERRELADELLTDLDLLDPDAPVEPERIAESLAAPDDDGARDSIAPALRRVGLVLGALVLLAVAWRWGPLSGLAEIGTLEHWGRRLAASWAGMAGVLAVYVAAALAFAPITALIAVAGLVFGPLSGLALAASGSLLAALAGYGLGFLVGRKTLTRLAGTRFDRLHRRVARRGIVSMTVLRLLPVAPFMLINMAAGASHIRFRDYVAGTVLGMAPGITLMTLFAGQLGRFIRSPDADNVMVLAGLILVFAAFGYWVWRRFARRRAAAKSILE